MARDLGVKHTCFKCSTKFYDMRKPEPLCPKCGADQRETPRVAPAAERRRTRSKPPEPAAAEADELEVPARAEEADDEEEDDDDEVEDVDDEA